MAETQVKLTRYALHDHPLVLQERAETMAECRVCKKPSSGPVFTCGRGEKCSFYAHKSCIRYPDVIETPFHPHPLKSHYLLFTCQACLTRQAGDCFKCPHTRCSLVLDLECALRVPATLPGLDGHEQIHHPDHLHPLLFYEKIDGEVEGTICRVCENKNDSLGPGYGCPECRFFNHNTCRELPKETQHPSHPFHALKRYPFTEFVCHQCLQDCNSFPYECSECDSRMDVRYAFFPASTEFESLKPIRLKFHQHPLQLYELRDHYGLDCRACEECCTGQMYTCLVCGFFLHKSCALLPEIIGNPSHPNHPLRRSGERQFKCSNCLIDRNSIHYYCPDSEFYLDSGCTFQYKGSRLVHHEIHWDLLEVFEKEDDNVNELECTVCHEPCSGTTYGCRICGFHLHKQCADIQEIQHPAHPFHPLKRAHPCDFKCHACLEDCHGTVCYYCKHCDFYIEIVCAFLEPPIEYKHQQYILHDMHKHPLTLSEKKDGDERVDCAACRRRCSGSTFECRVCDFVVHKSCTVLPETVTHPFHQIDSLQLVKTITSFTCSVCIKDYNALYYTCPGSSCSCSFKVDIVCALTEREHSLIIYQGHSHPLIFLKDIGDGKSLMCNECREPCASSLFHCTTCDFNLDLLCGPLPCALKHKNHHHVLTLRDSYNVESQECYCDSCEELRGPMTCVYYCPDCPYHAEINCVMPELIPALIGNSGDVELRTSGRWACHGKVISKGSTWKEIQHSNVEQRNDSLLEAEMDIKKSSYL